MKDWLLALSVGAGLTFAFFALGVADIVPEPFFETLLSPGSTTARMVYGGLHGGEPILLSLVANSVFYGMVAWLVMLLFGRLKEGR